MEDIIFRFSYRGKTVVVTIRPGFVRQDFIEMARKPNRTEEEEVILAEMKRDMAKRLWKQNRKRFMMQ